MRIDNIIIMGWGSQLKCHEEYTVKLSTNNWINGNVVKTIDSTTRTAVLEVTATTLSADLVGKTIRIHKNKRVTSDKYPRLGSVKSIEER